MLISIASPLWKAGRMSTTTPRSKRRGVETTPLFSHVTPETKQRIDAIAHATGTRKNVVIERIIEHLEVDSDGVPVWWPPDEQEELPLTG